MRFLHFFTTTACFRRRRRAPPRPMGDNTLVYAESRVDRSVYGMALRIHGV